jgi:preprotein translocase subunit SecG
MSAITFTANVAKVRVAPAIRGRVRARAGARVAIRASAGEEGTRVASFDAGVKRVGAVVGSVAAATAAEPAFAAAHEVAEVSATSQTFTHVALQPGHPCPLIHYHQSFTNRLTFVPSNHQVAANGVLENLRLFIAIASVALILFQGPKGDGVVNSLNERRVFGSAAETKSAVDYVTAGLIGSFIVLSAVLAATQ